MTLKYNVTAEEHGGLGEGIKELYAEKDGVFVLAVEGIDDASALKGALEKERAAAKEYKKQVAAWEAIGKKPEEISEIIKRLEQQKPEQDPPKPPTEDKGKDKTPPKGGDENDPFKDLAKKVESELAAQRAEMAALRKEQAEKNEREKQREREARIRKEFEGYSEEQKTAFVRIVEGEKDEEIAESVKAVKAMFPIPVKPVGGPTNPPKKTPDTEPEAVKIARALAEKKLGTRKAISELLKNT
ncbi:MAG: hypothetical protein LBQ42_09045 [Synergistaceae bacterium]|jgi:hypothetical protein|nr:hypothetical protein [Synergistaceae bacterium]